MRLICAHRTKIFIAYRLRIDAGKTVEIIEPLLKTAFGGHFTAIFGLRGGVLPGLFPQRNGQSQLLSAAVDRDGGFVLRGEAAQDAGQVAEAADLLAPRAMMMSLAWTPACSAGELASTEST